MDSAAFQLKPAALVVYVTCGDPDLATSEQVVLAAIDAGADVIELGVPFSDPLADGPVIQRASERALAKGTRLDDVLQLAARVRKQRKDTKLVIFSYLNPLVRCGLDKFAEEAQRAGVDGVLATDMTLEESDEYRATMKQRGLATIFLAAPTSTDARLKKVAAASSGFIYAVSRTGVTGAQSQVAADAQALVKRIRKVSKLPVALGFGISNAQQFREVTRFADAAVIGSAIVRIIEEHSASGDAPQAVANFIRELRPGGIR